MRIFFSHSSSDKPLLRELTGYLPRWIATWIDENELLLGAGLEDALHNAIDFESDYVVLFLRRSTIDSEWVRKEVDWALTKEATINRQVLLTVALEDVEEALVELGLNDRLYISLANHNRDGIESLARELTNHLGAWLSEVADLRSGRRYRATNSNDEFTADLESAITAIPKEWRSEVDRTIGRPFLRSLRSSQIGNIPLNPDLYYQRILQDMSSAGAGWTITAVSTLTSKLWGGEADQARYAERNLSAVQRGAIIRRVFVIRDGEQHLFKGIARIQKKAGIDVRIATSGVLADLPDMEDFVLFAGPDVSRGYVARPTVDGLRRIASGQLVLAPDGLIRLDTMFKALWDLAPESGAAFDTGLVERRSSRSKDQPPGLVMTQRSLSEPVVTCDEAAHARGIPLANELKTLVLQTSEGLVAAHLPGDGILSLRKVKDRLESAEAYLADPEDILKLGLSAGTVSAVLDPVWSMPHLISRRLLNFPEVMTNNGTRIGFFAFDPAVLTEAKDVVVGDFEK